MGDYSSFDYLNCTMHGLLHPYHVAYENEGKERKFFSLTEIAPMLSVFGGLFFVLVSCRGVGCSN